MKNDSPTLWRGSGGSADLIGVTCASCGAAFFPPQHYGCEACGAPGEQLKSTPFPAVGRLHTFAAVHLHAQEPTPYTVAEIVLDAGPLVRALLADDVAPRIGMRVRGIAGERSGVPRLLFVKPEGDR